MDVSVVIPTRDRAARLASLLESLGRQEGVAFEAVVVDDGSRDTTPELLLGEWPFELRPLRLDPSQGPAVARNAGWRAAHAPLVAFTDDDCEVAPGWLAALVAAHRRAPGALIQGRTEPHPGEAARQGAFTRSQLVTSLGPNFQTCNIAYPRALLEQLGGFDESYPHYAEDADLAWRAIEAGAPAEFAAGALVHHAIHETGALDQLRDSQRWVHAVRCFRDHPQMRSAFRRRVFWRPSHEGLVLTAVALALARPTRGLSLVLAVPYLRFLRTQHGSWAGAVASLPAHVLVDAAEVAAMARGSARYRTFVL
ncbi:MAG TPA: glycosyltransferase [Thermoleophilaceae bacterium]|nr:glycosyltransferase [Thermoleophilaceae bacterium]